MGKKPTMEKWIQHLLKVDHRYAKDPIFIMVVTNVMQKKQALSMGSIYADRCTSDLNIKEIKDKLLEGDKDVLRSIYHFSASIKGSQQFFSGYQSKACSFLRDIRIQTNGKEMFNLFLTFSAADNHWYNLHKNLPGHEQYLDKIVIDKEIDIPSDAVDKSLYITKALDYQLRKKAIDENQHIVNQFFQKRVKTIWETVLQPILGGEEYIMRYEFQMRHAIHCHMIMTMKNGPSCEEMELAKQTCPKINHESTEDQIKRADDINNAKNKMIEFNSLLAGIFALHPQLDPVHWPPPLGQNPYTPEINVLREPIKDFNDPHYLYEYSTRLVNRVETHKCTFGYCLDSKRFEKIKKSTPEQENIDNNIDDAENDSKDQKKDSQKKEDKKYLCRFNFPFNFNGFKPNFDNNDILESIEPDIKDPDDPLKNPMIYGASYDLLAEDILVLLRNNPYVNNHITEILALWGANCDQKCITSYHQVIKYLLKYVMKPEKQSKHFEALSKAITNKIDQDTPLKSCCQKILMSCIAERDMGTNECFLICQNLPYVELSKTPRYANLKGSFKVKTKINKESDTIADSDNWQESYWTRETIEGYQILCSDFEKGTKKVFKDKHPKDIP